jgi:hypothetical protein
MLLIVTDFQGSVSWVSRRFRITYVEHSPLVATDIDIHHGNGCQSIFYDTNKVLHISLHRQIHGLVESVDGGMEVAEYAEEVMTMALCRPYELDVIARHRAKLIVSALPAESVIMLISHCRLASRM